MPPCRPGYGGFSCLQEGVDIDIRENHQTGVSGIYLKGHRHKDRHICQQRKGHGSNLHRRLDYRSLRGCVKRNHCSRQGTMERSEDPGRKPARILWPDQTPLPDPPPASGFLPARPAAALRRIHQSRRQRKQGIPDQPYILPKGQKVCYFSPVVQFFSVVFHSARSLSTPSEESLHEPEKRQIPPFPWLPYIQVKAPNKVLHKTETKPKRQKERNKQ